MSFPRLLTRRDIDTKKAQERQREIDEGSKLARTVDGLREIRADEEKKLDEWRTTAIAAAQKDIREYVTQVEMLVAEVNKLESRKNAALKTLDGEWEQVFTAQKSIKKEIEENNAKSEILRAGEADLALRKQENSNETQRITEERRRTTEELVAAARAHDDARTERRKSTERSEIMNAALDLREKEVSEREKKASDVVYRAEQTTMKIEKYEVDLMKRELALRDGWRTLEETKKELHV